MGPVRHAHHRPTPHPDHPALPSDAIIHDNPAVLAKLQEWENNAPADKPTPTVAGYATSPNPSHDGDWVRNASEIIYWWYKDNPHTISQADAAEFGA